MLSQSTNPLPSPANVFADVVTVMLSLKLLWRVKLPRRQCRMILYLFTASRFLCIISLAHAIAQLVVAQNAQEILAYVQVCPSWTSFARG